MGRRVDLRELSNQLSNEIKRLESEEVPVTQHNLNRLREMENLLKRQRLAYKELYVYICHQMDVAVEKVDDKIARLEARLPELPEGLEDIEAPDDDSAR